MLQTHTTLITKMVIGSLLACAACACCYFFIAAKSDRTTSTTQGKCMDIYRLQIGACKVTAVCDGYNVIDAHNLITVDNNGKTHAYTTNDTRSTLKVPINIYIIKTASQLILVDTGRAGTDNSATGLLPDCMLKAGYTPEQVDVVLITHEHSDHTSGLVTPDGKRAFTNATVYISNLEKDAQKALAPYDRAGKLERFHGKQKLVDGITALPTPGHTIGHASYMLESEDKKILFWGDLIHRYELQFANPDIAITFDSDPQQAIESRKKILALVAAEHIMVAGAHLPVPGLGYVQALPNKPGYAWIPLTSPELKKEKGA